MERLKLKREIKEEERIKGKSNREVIVKKWQTQWMEDRCCSLSEEMHIGLLTFEANAMPHKSLSHPHLLLITIIYLLHFPSILFDDFIAGPIVFSD